MFPEEIGLFFLPYAFVIMGGLEERRMAMQKGTKFALLFGAVPFLTLVLALPLVNRLRPWIGGFPFLLFWILFWIFLTPLLLAAAYWAEKKYNRGKDEEGR